MQPCMSNAAGGARVLCQSHGGAPSRGVGDVGRVRDAILVVCVNPGAVPAPEQYRLSGREPRES